MFDWFNTVVADNFIAIKKLGSGSFSHVWMAYDFRQNKYVAIKIYFSKEYKNGESEAKVYTDLSKLKSKYILGFLGSHIHKNNENNKKYFINVFELMMFSSQNILKMDTFSEYGIPYNISLQLFKKVAEGIAEIHKAGYIHGDIKPENILIEGLSEECKTIMKKLNLENFIKKKSKKELPKLIMNLVEKHVKLVEDSSSDDDETDSDSDDDYSDSCSSSFEENISKLSLEDDRISISSNDDNDSDGEEVEEDILAHCNLSADKIKEDYNFLLEKCKNIKISDFGSSVKINNIDKTKKHIQTPYYRPPEILLRTDFNEKIDIWALGCILYEYLTGDILFDADDYYKINHTRYHLFLINQTVGDISLDLVNKCSNKDLIFVHNTNLVKCLSSFDISNMLMTKLKKLTRHKNLSDNDYDNLCDILIKMLDCDKNKRITISDVLAHPIFA